VIKMYFGLTCLIVLVLLTTCWGKVKIYDFYPHGLAHGDMILAPSDDTIVNISLRTPVTICNTAYKSMVLSNNGFVFFGEEDIIDGDVLNSTTPSCDLPLKEPTIFPFWADIYTVVNGGGGAVFFKESNDSQILKKATADIKQLTGPSKNASLISVAIATWNDVAFHGAADPTATCMGRNLRNYFQLILATSKESESYAIFYYGKVNWTSGFLSYNNNTGRVDKCLGLGGVPAKAGVSYGNGHVTLVEGSCTNNILNVAETSNVGDPGKWIFRLNDCNSGNATTSGVDAKNNGGSCLKINGMQTFIYPVALFTVTISWISHF